MLMVYYRFYITSTLTGVLFDLDQSNVLKDIHKLERLIKEILPLPKKLHDKAKRLQSIEEIEALFPEFKAFTDATKQEISRPRTGKNAGRTIAGKGRGTP
jgi:hypothetical protein